MCCIARCDIGVDEVAWSSHTTEAAMDGVRKREDAVPGRSESAHRTVAGHASDEGAPRNLVILSDIRFLREGLSAVLARDGAFVIGGVAADLGEAVATATA